MKAKFLIAIAALVVSAAPVFANTPSADPFGGVPNDEMMRPAPDHTSNGEAYIPPFDDHMWQSQSDDVRPVNGGNRDNLAPPPLDASGVPDPRI
jgi:hypothetical protein